MPQLTQQNKDSLKKYIELYNQWLLTSEGKENLEEHRAHSSFFKGELSKENIDLLDEKAFGDVYKKLWASNIWGNKDWYIENKLLKPNGLAKIKQELKALLYGEGSIDARIDRFWEQIKGFGPSSFSEILHFVFPDKYCLWNDKPKTVLPYLKINLLPERFFRYNLQNGTDYLKCIEALDLIRNELANYGFKSPDFIDVDCILWHIFNLIEPNKHTESEEVPRETKRETVRITKDISSHEEAEYYVLKLGKLLGYLTYTVDQTKLYDGTKLGDYAILKDIPDFAGQRDKNSAREIDAIWFNDDENPEYCLEIEHTTGITKGLNRLLQLQHFHVTFIIVASEDKRSKFETEMNKSPFRTLKDRYKFISYNELLELYDAASYFKEMKDKLLG